jgi:hypothetical protein
MMAKRPDERFSDPAALLVELHALATEGAQQGWATGLDHSALSQILRSADQRSVATTRLDELMKTTAIDRQKRGSKRRLLAGVVGCAFVGGALALLTGPRDLWHGAELGPPQRETVRAQLYQAKYLGTEAAWQSVIDYFPGASPYYHNLAKQGLVYFYFDAQEYDKAIQPLEELAAQPEFRNFGIAGLVVAYAKLNDDDQASIENQRLSADMRVALEKQSPSMAALLNAALDDLAERAL